ncbi:MAG TPA: MBL fold metallo-hydrolase [Bacillota bacterium]|jgi:phosphoribosyl 1,2-cyclic phosphodiesterase
MVDFKAHASSSAGNLYTVTDGGKTLVIECGVRFKTLQSALGFSLSSVSGLLVSHAHQDHAACIQDVLRASVPCYMSEGTAQALGVAGHHRTHILTGLRQVDIGGWTVLPFGVIHDADEPLGFLIVAPGGDRLVYAVDTAYVPYRFERLSVIAIEANFSLDTIRRNVASGEIALSHKNRVIQNHMSIERALDMLRANDLSQVREIHLLHLSDGNSDAEAFRRQVQELTGKPVYVAARQ